MPVLQVLALDQLAAAGDRMNRPTFELKWNMRWWPSGLLWFGEAWLNDDVAVPAAVGSYVVTKVSRGPVLRAAATSEEKVTAILQADIRLRTLKAVRA